MQGRIDFRPRAIRLVIAKECVAADLIIKGMWNENETLFRPRHTPGDT